MLCVQVPMDEVYRVGMHVFTFWCTHRRGKIPDDGGRERLQADLQERLAQLCSVTTKCGTRIRPTLQYLSQRAPRTFEKMLIYCTEVQILPPCFLTALANAPCDERIGLVCGCHFCLFLLVD